MSCAGGGCALGEMLGLNMGLRVLDCSHCRLRAAACLLIGEGIKVCCCCLIKLCFMALREFSCASLALFTTRLRRVNGFCCNDCCCQANVVLETLLLSGNDVGEAGARHLMSALACNGSLRFLGLSGTNLTRAYWRFDAAAAILMVCGGCKTPKTQ
jgi:hypothetical protein